MRRAPKYINTKISRNESYEGIPIEQEVAIATQTNQPIKMAGAENIFTERAQGVLPEYDIRTDRWEIAREAMNKISAASIAKREGPGESTQDDSKGKTPENE